MTQSGGTLPDGKVMLEHVVTEVLKQAKDGPCPRAWLEEESMLFQMSSLSCNRDALTYQDDNGIVKPLAIGHQNQL